MLQLRREIQRWGLPPPRRENLLTGLGQAVWRTLKRGVVRTTAQLRRLVWELLTHLRDAPEGVSASLKRACSYAGAIVLMGLRALGILGVPMSDHAGNDDAFGARKRRWQLDNLGRLYPSSREESW